MPAAVYILGSINYDLMTQVDCLPDQGETRMGQGAHFSVGGKGTNQAATCGSLGENTFLVGAVGNDFFGKQALSYLLIHGVDISKVNILNDQTTGTAFILTCDGDNRIIVNSGANASISFRQVEEALKQAQAGDLFVTQFETPMNLLLPCLKLAKEKGMVTLVNPSPYKSFDAMTYPLIDYLVLNQLEAQALCQGALDTLDDLGIFQEKAMELGLNKLVLTLGSRGSFLITKTEKIHEPAYSIQVVDSTGAGDAFLGGLAFALSQNLSDQASLTFANALGALTCLSYGAGSIRYQADQVYNWMAKQAKLD